MISYKKEWFNPLYFELRKYADDPNVRTILVYGGKSSSKTISLCQLFASHAVSKLKSTIAFRKESTIIRTTLKKSIALAIETHRLSQGFTAYDMSFKCYKGSEIILKGLEKEEKVKGIESYHYLYFDELNQFEEEEFRQANLSLRGQEGQKIFASWNPVNVNSWVKRNLIDKISFKNASHSLPCAYSFIRVSEDGKTVLIKTNYQDNFWIVGSPDNSYGFVDKNIIHEYENLKSIDENSYNVNVLGEWGVDDPNKLFAREYSRAKHFGKTFKQLYKPTLDIHLTWDFNIENTCYAIQNHGDAINVLKEYHTKGYDLQGLCTIIKADFKKHEFIINGDASGRARSALTSGNVSAYNILHGYLQFNWDFQFYVPAANPSHLNSRLLTNTIFKFYEVNISEECIELDIDLRSVEVDVNGSMNSYKTKNPERTHFLDPLRYHFNAHHRDKLSIAK